MTRCKIPRQRRQHVSVTSDLFEAPQLDLLSDRDRNMAAVLLYRFTLEEVVAANQDEGGTMTDPLGCFPISLSSLAALALFVTPYCANPASRPLPQPPPGSLQHAPLELFARLLLPGLLALDTARIPCQVSSFRGEVLAVRARGPDPEDDASPSPCRRARAV